MALLSQKLLILVGLVLMCLMAEILIWNSDSNIIPYHAPVLHKHQRKYELRKERVNKTQQIYNYSVRTGIEKVKKQVVYNNTIKKENKKVQKETSTTKPPFCPEWKKLPDWSRNVTPTFQMDNNKYLYPAVVWGPNNQVEGLIQSVYLAIKLNRTLVLPVMSTHQVHDTRAFLPTYQRLDVERLRDFISLMSLEEYRKKCHAQFDVGFMSHNVQLNDMKRLQTATEMKLFVARESSESVIRLIANGTRLDKSSSDPFIPVYPIPPLKPIYEKYLSPKTDELNKVFPSNTPCAVHLEPFKAINAKLHNGVAAPLDEKYKSLPHGSIPDDELYSAVTDSVQHTPVASKIANEFLENNFSGKLFAAVHWRFDAQDWQRHRCRKNPSQICKNVKQITGKDVAKSVFETIVNFQHKNKKSIKEIVGIYLATPPNLAKTFVPEFKYTLAKLRPEIKVISYNEVENFIDEKSYRSCINSWVSANEFASSLEMEICKQSEIFFYSSASSWSTFVRIRRIRKQKSKPVFSVLDIATKAILKRESYEKAVGSNYTHTETQS